MNIATQIKEMESLEQPKDKSVVDHFKAYAVELDAQYDLYEKLVKRGRDVTQESKKIIFLLHRVENKDRGKHILETARKRLQDVHFLITDGMGSLLSSKDVFRYLRAFTPGVQEFVEAVSFYYYLRFGKHVSIEEIHEATFLFVADDIKGDCVVGVPMSTLLTPSDYILGISDLTGELMRRCVASKSLEEPLLLCSMLADVYKAFKVIGTRNIKDLRRKYYTLKSSLRKVEIACYSIKVRLSEAHKVILTKPVTLGLDDLHPGILENAFNTEQDVYMNCD